ncbi:transcriptional repressor NrdR [Candidatus Woesearchaeota archaeon]|jgi:transcriptional repressor NrdR|nr:transcriptional repressor NrdR [Candidatus Woesearchaeota archaeon]MBT7332439.1 transcriptional repressor NrdR [Candidatus Woesearchaeota archaeon]
MYCLFCNNNDTKVLESRIVDDTLRRRRECLSCNNRFTTYERAEFNLKVQKKDGRIQEFDLEKIERSIKPAYGKVESQLIKSLATKVQRKILNKKSNPIKTIHIGKFILQELKKDDKMAYLRYATVYKGIEDPQILEKEIQSMR